MKKIKNVWGFIEQYYPNYSSSDEIVENGDLHKILSGEIEGFAEVLYNEIREEKAEFFGNTLNDKELDFEVLKVVQSLYEMTIASIYEQAIQGFINSNN